MAQHMTDEEQLQLLKNWWKENGQSLVAVVVIALGGYFGWQGWTHYQQQYAEKASTIYNELADLVDAADDSAMSEEDRSTATFLIKQLQEDYGRTFYAVGGGLLAAKLAVDADDLPEAEKQLQWVVDQAKSETKTLATLRLARIQLAQGKVDEALSLTQYELDDAFTGLFAEVQGDALLAKGDKTGAYDAYQKASESLPADNSIQRRMIEIKLANLASEVNP